jgi:hypothetical protein
MPRELRLRRDHVITLRMAPAPSTCCYQPPCQVIVHDWDRDSLLDLVINLGPTMKTGPAVLRNIAPGPSPGSTSPGG